MASPKVIAIAGATGSQGGSVTRTFLKLPNWKVRCLTRSATSAKAQELLTLGAEVVEANLDDEKSLSRAFDGAHAIFVNTDFWGAYSGAVAQGIDKDIARKKAFDIEVQQVKNSAIAAAGIPTLEKFIYSALGPMTEASGGKFTHSYHWETKAAGVKYIEREQPELAKKTSFIYMGAYSTNAFLLPKLDPRTGNYSLAMPGSKDVKFPIIDPVNSTGPFVRALVEDEEPGKKLVAFDSELSIGEVIDAWSEVTGKEADFVQMTLQQMHDITGLPFEVLDGAGFLMEFDYTAGLEGVIKPDQLKKKVETPSYLEFLKAQDKEYLLNAQFPQL